MAKTNVIIQCRYASSRLPGKILYPLCGIPVLAFLIRRLSQGLSNDEFRIIVATSSDSLDDPIAVWAKSEGAHLVRGEQEDVLSRYQKVSAAFPAPVHVRVTGDNPLTCPNIVKDCVILLKQGRLDYTLSEKFPFGVGVDTFSAPLMEKLHTIATTPFDREHINGMVLKNSDRFRIGKIEAKDRLARPDLRVTIDTLEDFNRVSRLLARDLGKYPWELDLETAITRLDGMT